jgi:hypothetical protein
MLHCRRIYPSQAAGWVVAYAGACPCERLRMMVHNKMSLHLVKKAQKESAWGTVLKEEGVALRWRLVFQAGGREEIWIV